MQTIGIWNVRTRYRKNRQPQTTITCSSKEVAEYLRSLGKYPKSVESHTNVLATIPPTFKEVFYIRSDRWRWMFLFK